MTINKSCHASLNRPSLSHDETYCILELIKGPMVCFHLLSCFQFFLNLLLHIVVKFLKTIGFLISIYYDTTQYIIIVDYTYVPARVQNTLQANNMLECVFSLCISENHVECLYNVVYFERWILFHFSIFSKYLWIIVLVLAYISRSYFAEIIA